jgi:hypothetical protein
MASIDFYVHNGIDFNITTGPSGLGFFGDTGFGASVPVGSWQGRTYVTDGNGVQQGPEAPNVKYLNAGSGILGQAGTGIGLQAIPNYQSTLNVRFTHNTAVRTQNTELRIFDRTNINLPASGVTTKVAEIIHPGITQVANGSGDSQWLTPGGSAVTVQLAPSPGLSGIFAGNGTNSVLSATRHDNYVALSASPDSIGAKTLYALYVSTEYL